MLFSCKKSKPNWFEIEASPFNSESVALMDRYYVCLRNLKRYPYAYEPIAQLKNPILSDKGYICFDLCPLTYHLLKRKQLFSPHNWVLQHDIDGSNQVIRSYATGWINKLTFQEVNSGNPVDFF